LLARALLGLGRDGERAWRYRRGDLDYTVGFVGEVARYLAVSKTTGGDFREGDVLALLSGELGMSQWTISPTYKDAPDERVALPKKGRTKRPIGRYFTAQRIDPANKNVLSNYLGWVWGRRNQFFLATPYAENAAPLPIDQAALTARLG